jgi:hypothetical protein
MVEILKGMGIDYIDGNVEADDPGNEREYDLVGQEGIQMTAERREDSM